MIKTRIGALALLIAGIGIGLFVFLNNAEDSKFPFQLGLDLSGGSYLTYEADLSEVEAGEEKASLGSLREVIEKRVDPNGSEQISVQTETISLSGKGKEYRLIVELPGVTDLDEATSIIGETPLLDFRVPRPQAELEALAATLAVDEDGNFDIDVDELNRQRYQKTDLTGQYITGAQIGVSQTVQQGSLGQPYVTLDLDKEGAKILAKLTEEYIGQPMAIFLDDVLLQEPIIRAVITTGEAQITLGNDIEAAQQLRDNLKFGALPVPVELISAQTIGPSLGADAVTAGVLAGLVGLLFIIAVLVLWYRLPGVIAAASLAIYGVTMLALFKLIPVTLTAAGIAGFIISLGIAVDANILIFERVKEELNSGQKLADALREGFDRAWPSIRDANFSSIISAFFIFMLGSPLIKGFALTFGIGVIVSMITAVVVTRIFMYAVAGDANGRIMRFLYSTGLHSGQKKHEN